MYVLFSLSYLPEFVVYLIINSSEKAWWTREFTKEYLPFVVGNSSLSILEGMLEKYRIYRVTTGRKQSTYMST